MNSSLSAANIFRVYYWLPSYFNKHYWRVQIIIIIRTTSWIYKISEVECTYYILTDTFGKIGKEQC